jgi:hypothetical protein
LRYTLDAIVFPWLVFNEWLLRKKLQADNNASAE